LCMNFTIFALSSFFFYLMFCLPPRSTLFPYTTLFRSIVMDAGYRAVWFLFKDQLYDVGRSYRPGGTWMGYYADVLEPVRWDGSDPTTLEPIIDLFLDLWIAPDGRFEVLDVDEFEEAGARGSITAYQIDHARRVLQKMIEATGRGDFPPAVVKQFPLRNTQPQEGHWS